MRKVAEDRENAGKLIAEFCGRSIALIAATTARGGVNEEITSPEVYPKPGPT
jgi:hypothetical protein